MKTVIKAPGFALLAMQIKEAKDAISAWQNRLKELEELVLTKFSAVNLSEDFEGTENITTEEEEVTIKVIHKLTRKIDVVKAREILAKHNLQPETLFNVDYKYSSTIYKVSDKVNKNLILDCTTTKRAKSQIDVVIKENEV